MKKRGDLWLFNIGCNCCEVAYVYFLVTVEIHLKIEALKSRYGAETAAREPLRDSDQVSYVDSIIAVHIAYFDFSVRNSIPYYKTPQRFNALSARGPEADNAYAEKTYYFPPLLDTE